jgi:hypothetical protein
MACSPKTASSKSPARCASLPYTTTQSPRLRATPAKAPIGSMTCSAAGLASLPVMKSSSMSSTSSAVAIPVLSSRIAVATVSCWQGPSATLTRALRPPASGPAPEAGTSGSLTGHPLAGAPNVVYARS